MHIRIFVLTLVFLSAFVLIAVDYYKIASEPLYIDTVFENSLITVNAGESEGTIYDRNMNPITNEKYNYIAVVVPSAVKQEEIIELAKDKQEFIEKFEQGQPFAFECVSDSEESPQLTVFKIPQRYSENQLAQHIIGYTSETGGMDGIEYAYDSILRGKGENSVTYSVDGFGNILIGDGKSVVRSEKYNTGVVTAIDIDIQRICEECGKNIEKGVVIVSDVDNGDLLAIASFPCYDTNNMESALNDENLPLINRALYSYSVGSAFKLVTACYAIENGFENYVYNCKGSIDIFGQIFNCHKQDGHGLQNMTKAMTNSCNTYFISMSSNFDPVKFRNTAFSLGFGRELYLCSGIIASAGVLPSEQDLELPAELANFSFGQGKLSATPLQINQLTCTIANGGELPSMRLIKGVTTDGKTVANEKNPQKTRVIDESTAGKLRNMMISAVEDSQNSNAKSKLVKTGAKTSTAQTGRFDKDGNELCHAWITGFFPADNPKYAVTVLVEDGGYGNDSSAPVFKEIAEKITQMQ